MRFNKLAKLFSELESTTKRLEMINILSNFFKNIDKNKDFADLDKIIYLLQGQLVSNIKQVPKLGIGEKMLIEALKIPSGWNIQEIKQKIIEFGDIGEAAEYILINKRWSSMDTFIYKKKEKKSSIEVTELYSNLLEITQIEGEKSQPKKLTIIKKLIEIITPLESKYLMRIIISTLRVGASTMTIIDGITEGFTGSKEGNRDIIEHAFNLHPDLGDVTKTLAEKGIEEIKKIKITYGIPIRMMLASRVPYKEIITKLGTPFTAEYKLDGERLQIHKQGEDVKLFSRQLLEISEQYPDVCQIILENIKAENVILEGEVVAMDAVYEKMLPFQVLSKRRRKYDVEDISKEVPVSVFLFDILKYEDDAFIDKTFPERRKKLEEIVIERDELRLTASVLINSTEELVNFFHEARQKGTEGVMTKSINEESFYQAGNRGFLWIKLKGLEGGKLLDSIDVVLVGAFYGKGRRTGVYGTLIGAVYDTEDDTFEAFTRVASGLTDDIMENIMKDMKQYKVERKTPNVRCDDKPDIWFKPEVVIEIIGDEITVSDKFSSLGYSMRFPVFKRIRHEKGAKDITTVEEIKDLYEKQ